MFSGGAIAHTLFPADVVIHSPPTAGGPETAPAPLSNTGLPVPTIMLCASIAFTAPLPLSDDAALGAALGADMGWRSARRGCAASALDSASATHSATLVARMVALRAIHGPEGRGEEKDGGDSAQSTFGWLDKHAGAAAAAVGAATTKKRKG